VDLILQPPQALAEARLDPAGHQQRLDAEILREAQAQTRQNLDMGEVHLAPLADDAPLLPELDMPDFVAE